MLDFWKTIVGDVLSWPVAAFILVLLFRKPLSELIGRINNIKAPGFELAAPPASAQLKEEAKEPPASLKGEIGSAISEIAVTPTATSPAVDAILEEKRAAVRQFGQGIAIVDEAVMNIKRQLTALNMPLDSEETGEILVRHLAGTQLMARCERTHRLIFGSQLLALHMMNNAGPQPKAALRPIFENACAQELQFYGSYTFEDWLGFLIKEVTVTETEKGLYGITVYGRSYLDYIAIFAPGPRPH
jgi:hypothetical protein